MTILQTPTPTQAQQLPPQAQPFGAFSIALARWNDYGFSIPKSRIQSWLAKARVNGIMREGAVLRFGQRYFVDPLRLDAWMHKHSEGTPLTRGTAKRRRGKDTKEEKRLAPTDGKGQQAKQQPTPQQAKKPRRGNLEPGKPSLEPDQVADIRRQAAGTPPEGRVKLYADLAAKYSRHTKVIAECATGKTYKHLPLTETYAASEAAPQKAGKRGRKSKGEGQHAAQPTAG
jgi:hypothetical protein